MRSRVGALEPADVGPSGIPRGKHGPRWQRQGGIITMRTTEGAGVLIPGGPQDLVLMESDYPVPVTIYSVAESLAIDGRPVSSTEVEIQWGNGDVTFVERWHPGDLVRNLVASSVRVTAVFYDAGYTSPRSGDDRVTAWACTGHAARPRASKLWQFPTQIGDPLSGTEPNIVPPFADRFVLLADDWTANSFFSAPGAYMQFVEGTGAFLASQSRGFKIDDSWLPGAFYGELELPPAARSMIWASAGAAWLGDADWLAIKFLCRL